MTDIGDLAEPGEDDVAFALRIIREPGVAAVPGVVVLLATRARPHEAPVRLPEAHRDAGGRRRAAGPARGPRLTGVGRRRRGTRRGRATGPLARVIRAAISPIIRRASVVSKRISGSGSSVCSTIRPPIRVYSTG